MNKLPHDERLHTSRTDLDLAFFASGVPKDIEAALRSRQSFVPQKIKDSIATYLKTCRQYKVLINKENAKVFDVNMLINELLNKNKILMGFLSRQVIQLANSFQTNIVPLAISQFNHLIEDVNDALLHIMDLCVTKQYYSSVMMLGETIIPNCTRLSQAPEQNLERISRVIIMHIDASVVSEKGFRSKRLCQSLLGFAIENSDMLGDEKYQMLYERYIHLMAYINFKSGEYKNAMAFCLDKESARQNEGKSQYKISQYRSTHEVNLADLLCKIGHKFCELNQDQDAIECYKGALRFYLTILQRYNEIVTLRELPLRQKNKAIAKLAKKYNLPKGFVVEFLTKPVFTQKTQLAVLERKVNQVNQKLIDLKKDRYKSFEPMLDKINLLKDGVISVELMDNAFLSVEARDQNAFQLVLNALCQLDTNYIADNGSLTIIILDIHNIPIDIVERLNAVKYVAPSNTQSNPDAKQKHPKDNEACDEAVEKQKITTRPKTKKTFEGDRGQFNSITHALASDNEFTVVARKKNKEKLNGTQQAASFSESLLGGVNQLLLNHIHMLNEAKSYSKHPQLYFLLNHYHLVRFFQLAHVFSLNTENTLTQRDNELYSLRNALMHDFHQFDNLKLSSISREVAQKIKPRLLAIKNGECIHGTEKLRLRALANKSGFSLMASEKNFTVADRLNQTVELLEQLKLVNNLQIPKQIKDTAKVSTFVLIGELFKEINSKNYHFCSELAEFFLDCKHKFRNRAGHEINQVHNNKEKLPYDLFSEQDIAALSKTALKKSIRDAVADQIRLLPKKEQSSSLARNLVQHNALYSPQISSITPEQTIRSNAEMSPSHLSQRLK